MAYRIYQEPAECWRYADTNLVFAGLLAKALIGRALSRTGVPAGDNQRGGAR